MSLRGQCFALSSPGTNKSETVRRIDRPLLDTRWILSDSSWTRVIGLYMGVSTVHVFMDLNPIVMIYYSLN